ncbi:NTP transferase domain-containing protein [Zavarzinia sp.]|uniref:NTP transferase domain-containing protein n=1 Tax=Zavarzinia sp. TaxID=2027920 RepID=UPI00356899FD
MIFAALPPAEVEGAILAHSRVVAGQAWKKGRLLSAADAALLAAERREPVFVARLEADDVPEDEVARRLAAAICGPGAVATAAFTGRANLYAEGPGLFCVDAGRIAAINAVDEAITVATLAPDEMVEARQMLATVKVMPFAVPRPLVERALAAAGNGRAVAVDPFRPLTAALIVSRDGTTKESVIDKTMAAMKARLAAVGGTIADCLVVEHRPEAIAAAIRAAAPADLLLIAGAHAVIDRADHIPAALVAAGGEVLRFGMPVDPGNLLLLGALRGRPVIGVPGCARNLKLNGFDFVLRRLAAGVPVDGAALAGMGVGGLLKETAIRARSGDCPTPPPPRAPRLGALVLAAGRSSRMAEANKLTLDLGGKPLLLHAVDAALAAGLDPVVVVTGHDADKVAPLLAGRPVTMRHNPDYAEGLSSSLRTGVSALGAEIDGAFVMLGDMPRVTAEHLARLAAAFAPDEGRAIAVPTVGGRWGNPLLWARRFFPAMAALDGDRGARLLAAANPDWTVEVAMADDGVLIDLDTRADYAAARGGGDLSA